MGDVVSHGDLQRQIGELQGTVNTMLPRFGELQKQIGESRTDLIGRLSVAEGRYDRHNDEVWSIIDAVREKLAKLENDRSERGGVRRGAQWVINGLVSLAVSVGAWAALIWGTGGAPS